jgi:hypothetical protein
MLSRLPSSHVLGDLQQSSSCQKGIGTNDIQCPITPKGGGVGFPSWVTVIPNATYVLRNKDAFYKQVYEDYGIEKSWVDFVQLLVRSWNGCQHALTEEEFRQCVRKRSDWCYNYPSLGKIDILNLKDLIGNGYKASRDLLRRRMIWQNNAEFDSEMPWAELADAGALPAFTIDEAVAKMDRIVESVNKIEEKERKSFILDFISGLLFFIPFVGSGASAGLSSLRGTFSLIGTAG